jgi:cellulose synthase/poly-beta-1,6-N-acetylglucosamine synthase-like glycosyltransferase
MLRVSWQSAPRSRSSSTNLVSAAFRCLAVTGVITDLASCIDVIQVAHHFFENGIAHFTRRINKCISLACANGEVAPFVGHNAFLRWSALQDAAFIDPVDNVKKIWSESNVSEDFDMALRLQLKGYIIRWSNYSEGGFKEGVSLTVDDELNRWQKYSYGSYIS